MNKPLLVTEIEVLDGKVLDEFSQLLVDVVNNGASIGFIFPFGIEQAKVFWSEVKQPNVILWAARIDGQLCGTIQLHLITKPNGSHRCEVAKLMVHPHFRKRGIAKALMDTLEARARAENRKLVVLDTRLGDPANLLYQSLGYIEVGQIPDFAQSVEGELEPTVYYYKHL